jgi:endonuclease/exonuclease/phosphatase family metal-dependent hydrolase
MESINIITINTWKGEGNYSTRVEHLANELKRLDADIIAWQECFRCKEKEEDTQKYPSDHFGLFIK